MHPLTALLHDLHHFALGLAQACATDLFVTASIKFAAGKYRPNFANLPADLQEVEGRLSFPSGHSSISFAGMLYLSLYLAGKLRVFVHNSGEYWKLLIVCFPQAVAVFVAISRTRDYWHDFTDVLAGSVIGCVVAIVCYHLHFRTVTDVKCDRPKLRPVSVFNDRSSDTEDEPEPAEMV
eukprot:TRINITY_DN5248_c0_g1_i2.p1 TRINITY_DN5248_c0_g1~~TRINITY_DN5248_c0_g1_i2.p1  ORF type:complete len:179 (-),score=35.89 TRINITY_DN5248_c0_g1_i2:166-702(-)